MEIVIVVAIWSVIVKRGVEDILHTARGGTPHRYKEARKGGSGAWGRYWRTLSDDVASDLLDRHNQRRARRAGQPPRPTFADRWKYGRMAFRYARWNAHNRLKRAWAKHEERRREKATGPRPGQDTVPGEVVPNRDETQDEQQDGTEDRPQDEDRPDPASVPAEDGTDLQDEQDGDDPTNATEDDDDQEDDEMDATERAQWDAYKRFIEKTEPWPIKPATTTQEGPTTMTTTMPTGTEVVSLNKAIEYSESTARVATEMINSIDFTESSLAAGGVTGIAIEAFSTAKEGFGTIAGAMERAAAEFKAQLAIQEAYNANPGAGDKEFIMGGR